MSRYIADQHVPYFCTITVLDWLPVFIDFRYMEPMIESLRFCRTRKALLVFAYVIMPNHLHLIAGTQGDLHATMRDFKRFTSRAIHDRLRQDGRFEILEWLRQGTQRARRERDELGLWQDGFHPQSLRSDTVFRQKLDYLHANPVRKGLVRSAQDWWYSSAGEYAGQRECCMPVDPPPW